MSGTPLLRAASTVFAATAVVSVLNYLRDSAVVATLGAGVVSDAFFSALLVPTVLVQTLLPGILSGSLLPVYEHARHSGDRGATLLGAVGVSVVTAGSVLAAAVVLWAPRLVAWLLPGFAPDAAALTAEALRWLLAVLPLLAAGVLVRAALHASERFAIAALTPGLTGAAVLVALVAGGSSVRTLGMAAAAGFVAQLVVLAAALARAGIRVRVPAPRDLLGVPGLARVGALAAPLTLAAFASFLPTVIERWWASHLAAGTVAHLTLVQRLVGLPLVLLGASVSVALFPRLAAAAAAGDRARFRDALDEGVALASPPLLLCAAWLGGAADTVVALLYRHGAFTVADAAATATLLRSYAWGLPAMALWPVLSRGLTARQDAWAHAALVVGLIPLDLLLLAGLVPRLGAVGLGCGFAAVTWLGIGLQAAVLAGRHRTHGVGRLARRIGAWLPAALAALLATGACDVAAGGGGLAASALAVRLLAAGAAGLVAFLVVARLCGSWRDPRQLVALVAGAAGRATSGAAAADPRQAGDDQAEPGGVAPARHLGEEQDAEHGGDGRLQRGVRGDQPR